MTICMRRILLLGAALLLAACAARLPLTRSEAVSAAQNWCLREGRVWGDPAEVTPPDKADAQGRTWWTVRFPAPAGESRIVKVDAASGWTSRGR